MSITEIDNIMNIHFQKSVINDKADETAFEIIDEITSKTKDKQFEFAAKKQPNELIRTSNPAMMKLANHSSGFEDLKNSKTDGIPRASIESPFSGFAIDLTDQRSRESECFSVFSDFKFLYQIGKICAESGKYLEEGILCLNDYINILNFCNSTDIQQTGKINEMKNKATYLAGMIFYQVKDYEECELYLSQVKMNLLEIKDFEKYRKCEHILSEIFQMNFDLYNDDLIDDYFYPEFGSRIQEDSLDYRY